MGRIVPNSTQRRDGDNPQNEMLQENELSLFWRERVGHEGRSHLNWREQAFNMQHAREKIDQGIRRSLSQAARHDMDKTLQNRDQNGTRKRNQLSSNNIPTRELPPRSVSALEPPPKANRCGAAGHVPVCQLGKTTLYPTRFVRGKATMRWKHFLNNFSGRNNKMQATQTEAMARYVEHPFREKRLPEGKGILTRLCDGATPQKRVFVLGLGSMPVLCDPALYQARSPVSATPTRIRSL